MNRGRRRLRFALAALLVAAFAPSQAHATPVETVVQDDALLLHGTEDEIRTAVGRIRDLGFDRVRLTAGWSVIAPNPDSPEAPDFDPADPAAYPAGNWVNLDRAVRLTREAGLEVVIDIAFWAPRWATKDPDALGDRLATQIDAPQYARFAQAVATRYSGDWSPPAVEGPAPQPEPSPDRDLLEELLSPREPAPRPQPTVEAVVDPTPLPAVSMFTIWNEPNHPGFLRPQWKEVDGEWVPRSAEIYREMVRAAYPAIKHAAPAARVLVGGTASMGSSTPGVSGVPPLRFLRALACVDDKLRPVTTGTCAGFDRLPGDGWAHHPYSLRTTPDVDTHDTDKLPVAGTRRLTRTLRALADSGRVASDVADVYMTEYGYETREPDPNAPFTAAEQLRLLSWAEFIATSDPAVRMWPQFQLYDRPNSAPRAGMREYGDWHSGLYFNDGTPKPAAAGYATPAFAACVRTHRGRWALVWGRVRGSAGAGTVAVEVRGASGAWRAVQSFDRPDRRSARRAAAAGAVGKPQTRFVPHRTGAVYRLRWKAGGVERTSPAITPAAAGCRRRAGVARTSTRTRARRAGRRA